MSYTPPSIKSLGGLQKFLNDKKDDHNGYGYDDLVYMQKVQLSIRRIAFNFGVDPRTIKNWINEMDNDNGTLS